MFRREAGLAVGGALLAAAVPASAGEPLVKVGVEGRPIDVRSAAVVLVAKSGSTVRSVPFPLTAATANASLELRQGVEWRITCRGKGIWCPTLTVSKDARDPISLTLPAFPAAKASGRLDVARGYVTPHELVIEGNTRGPGRPVAIHETVAVSAGRVQLTLPRTAVDLRIASRPFRPIYKWNLRATGNQFDLGVLVLRPGASVSGTATDSVGRRAHGASVALSPVVDAGGDERERLLEVSGRTDAAGFFQLQGIRPGRYRLTLQSPAGLAVMEHVEVVADSETDVGEIAIFPPANLAVVVQPGSDPDGKPWRVRLRPGIPGGGPSRMREREVATTDGHARLANLAPGSFILEVSDGAGSRYHSQTVEISASQLLSVSIPIIRVKGTLAVGGEAVAGGEVWLFSANLSKTFVTDETGAFQGWIRRPRGNGLAAEVVIGSRRLKRRVELRDLDPDADPWNLDISLGDIVLAGQVVDEDGLPVAGAMVWADAPVAPAGSESDGDGRFTIEGLEPTRYSVAASFEHSAPGPAVEIDATAGGPLPPVTLEVPRVHRTRVRVATPDGEGVGSAMLTAYILGYGEGGSLHTDWEGWAPVRLPARATTAHVSVHAAGRLLWSGCSALPAKGEDWIVRIPPDQGGRLTVRTDEAIDAGPPAGPPGRFFLLRRGGGLLDAFDLGNWLNVTGGGTEPVVSEENGRIQSEWRLPGLAPGSYALMWKTAPLRPDFMASICAGSVPADLDWVTLPPGGEALVTLGPSSN